MLVGVSGPESNSSVAVSTIDRFPSLESLEECRYVGRLRETPTRCEVADLPPRNSSSENPVRAVSVVLIAVDDGDAMRQFFAQ